MFTSLYDIQLQPGKFDEAVELVRSMGPELEKIEGLKQVLVIQRGPDRSLLLAIYESQALQEAAAPKARELVGQIAGLVAVPPTREGCKVVLNQAF